MGKYIDQDNNLVLLGVDEILAQLPKSQPCETCDQPLRDHWWIALDECGLIVKCDRENNGPNPPRWRPNQKLKFSHYVSYNGYGGVDSRIERWQLEEAWDRYKNYSRLYLNVWQLEIENDKPGVIHQINVRLAPDFAIDGKDNNWRSCNYSFLPENYKWIED